MVIRTHGWDLRRLKKELGELIMNNNESRTPIEIELHSFNFKEFINQPDPNRRVLMASKFFDNASNTWAEIYANMASKLSHMISETKKQSAQRAEKTQEKTILAQALFLLYGDLDPNLKAQMKSFGMETKPEQEVVEDFKSFLNLRGPLSETAQENLNWLVEMITSGNTSLYMLDAAKPEERQKLKENLLRTVPFGIGLFKEITSNEAETKLIIAPDLLPKNLTGIDFLIVLAHEKGHEILKDHADLLEKKGDSALVFDEFFAVLEQIRLLSSLSDEQTEQITDGFSELFSRQLKTGLHEGNTLLALAAVYEDTIMQLAAQGKYEGVPLFTQQVGK